MRVNVTKLEQHHYSAGETLHFELQQVDNSFANALRRVMLAEIPTLAIDSVTIFQNSSVLPDEMIAHRLGLLPITSIKARDMEYSRDCVCEKKGCSHCEIPGRLKVRCPDDEHSRMVFAGEIQIENEEVRLARSENDTKGPWLLTLGRSQEIELEFVIRKGIGKVHAKFMPVATVSMHFASDIQINSTGLQALSLENRKLWVDRCPRKVFKLDDATGQVLKVNPQDCIYCKECSEMEPPFDNLPETLVVVRRKQDKITGFYDFTFTVESTGVLPVVQLVFDGIQVLIKKLEKIQYGLLSSSGSVVPTRSIGGAPTAPKVVNEDVVEREEAEDDMQFVMN